MMNRNKIINKHKTDNKINGPVNIIIKLLVVVVIITSFITIFVNAPASDSFFTDRIESEPYSVEF